MSACPTTTERSGCHGECGFAALVVFLATRLLWAWFFCSFFAACIAAQDLSTQQHESRATLTQIINPPFLEKKRELVEAQTRLQRMVGAEEYFRSVGNNTKGFRKGYRVLQEDVNRLEYELSRIPALMTQVPRPAQLAPEATGRDLAQEQQAPGVRYIPIEIEAAPADEAQAGRQSKELNSSEAPDYGQIAVSNVYRTAFKLFETNFMGSTLTARLRLEAPNVASVHLFQQPQADQATKPETGSAERAEALPAKALVLFIATQQVRDLCAALAKYSEWTRSAHDHSIGAGVYTEIRSPGEMKIVFVTPDQLLLQNVVALANYANLPGRPLAERYEQTKTFREVVLGREETQCLSAVLPGLTELETTVSEKLKALKEDQEKAKEFLK